MLTSTAWLTASHIKLAFAAISVALATAGCSAVTAGPPDAAPQPARSLSATAPEGPLVQQLAGKVSATAALQHLQALQRIADGHGGNRTTGTPGYDATVDYVVGVLRDDGFKVSTPTFESSWGGDGENSGPQRNVIAQTSTGDPAHVVMIGAHLDSVTDGPGIVDDGSGVATLLEIAARLGPRPAVQNAVRFAFFGGEENGSAGSRGYVEGLSAGDRRNIELYLNVDMVASRNGGYFAQGGKGGSPDEAGPPGSATIARVLADQLAKSGVRDPEITEFVGDDESPFIAAGIPVGGAENGDAQEKSAAQAGAWGGQAGEHFDSCYHQACDTIDNVNRDVLGHYLRALAATLAYFAG